MQWKTHQMRQEKQRTKELEATIKTNEIHSRKSKKKTKRKER